MRPSVESSAGPPDRTGEVTIQCDEGNLKDMGDGGPLNTTRWAAVALALHELYDFTAAVATDGS